MTRAASLLLAIFAVACLCDRTFAQWCVGGHSYSCRVDKYDSFFGEARPIVWSVQRPPGVLWIHMMPVKRIMHARKYRASRGYPAVYHAAYPTTYHSGMPDQDALGYHYGSPFGYPVAPFVHASHACTWYSPNIQVEPVPGDDEPVPPPSLRELPERPEDEELLPPLPESDYGLGEAHLPTSVFLQP